MVYLRIGTGGRTSSTHEQLENRRIMQAFRYAHCTWTLAAVLLNNCCHSDLYSLVPTKTKVPAYPLTRAAAK
eukprot:235922-Pelagomonas_calceolata.AAC.1